MNGSWIDPHVEFLKELWASGDSCSVIADRINRKFSTSYTRNAVIGKVTRLDLPPRIGRMREDPHTTARRMRSRRAAWARAQRRQERIKKVGNPTLRALLASDGYVPPPEEIVIPIEERKGLLDLQDNDCRWPIGDVRAPDFHFCGKEKVPGLSYCPAHACRAYAVSAPRKPAEIVPFPVQAATHAQPRKEMADA